MYFNRVLEIQDLLTGGNVQGQQVADYLNNIYQSPPSTTTTYTQVSSAPDQQSDVVTTQIASNAPSPGLMAVGQGNAIANQGAYHIASDADGIICALVVAAELLKMTGNGLSLNKSITISTHIRYAANDMDISDDLDVLISQQQTTGRMFDGILTVRALKDNSRTNFRGFGISPTVKEGWILPMSGDLFRLAGETSGELPQMLPITMYDITRGNNNVPLRANNLLTPNIFTDKPVVGIGISTQTKPPRQRANASHFVDIEETVRFIVEAALAYDRNALTLYDAGMFARAKARYSSIDMSTLQQITI